jgi:hypothetical protein
MGRKLFSTIIILIAVTGLLSADVCFAEAEVTGNTPDPASGSGTPTPGGSSSTTDTGKKPLFQLVQPTGTRLPTGETVSKTALLENLPKGEWTDLMAKIINLVLGITGSLAFASFTYGGVMMVTAQGNDEKICKGKNIIFLSILALAIIAASYGIVVGITQLRFFQ